MVDDGLGRGESPSVNVRAVIWATVGILVVLAAIAFGFELVFRDRIGMTYVERHPLPRPGVIPDERSERKALEAWRRAALDGGGGRMPIEAAMRAVAARGEHAFDPVGTPK